MIFQFSTVPKSVTSATRGFEPCPKWLNGLERLEGADY